jgi:hypothetical protein
MFAYPVTTQLQFFLIALAGWMNPYQIMHPLYFAAVILSLLQTVCVVKL